MILADRNFVMISAQTILKGLHDAANFSDLCRLCGNKKFPAVSVFDKTSRTSYRDIINFHFRNIQISNSDALPLKLCNDCAKFVVSWHHFHYECVRINEVLSRIVDKCQIESVQSEPNYIDGKNEIEVIEVGVESCSQNTEKSIDSNNTVKSSNKLSENNVEMMMMIVDESYQAENAAEINIVNNNDVISKVLMSSTTHVADSSTVSNLQNLSPNQHTLRADEFLVDVAELSGCSKSESEVTVEARDEIVVLLPEPQNESLLKGFMLNDSTSQFHCSSCFKAHVTKEELLDHIYIEHKTNIDRTEMYECDMCSLLFVKNFDRNSHRSNVHNIRTPLHEGFRVVKSYNQAIPAAVKFVDDENLFRCEYCKINFNRRGKLKIHNVRKHGVIYQNTRRCSICSMVLLNKRALRLHLKTVHARVPDEGTNTITTLSEEYLQFLSKRIVYHDGTRYFQCEECPYRCHGLHQFMRHEKRHRNANPSCAYCGKSFTTKGLLRRHITTVHLRIKNFQCDICKKMFGEKRHMQEHMNLHSTECSYVCEVCGKQFKQRQSLSVHKQIHEGEKSFQCEYCNKAFNFKNQLSIHTRKHTGKNLSVCQLCGKKFTNSTSLKLHMVSHLDVKAFTCAVCGKKLKTNRSLKQHISLYHKNKENLYVPGHYVFVDTNSVTINKYSKADSDKSSTLKEGFSGDIGGSNGSGATKCNKCGSVFMKSKVESANNRGTCYSCYSKMTKSTVTTRISPIFKNYLVTDENRQNYFFCDLCNFSCDAFPDVFAHHYKTEHPRANLYLSFVNETDDPLRKFIREKNGIRSYRCDCCQLSCISRNVFVDHYAKHDNRTLKISGSLMIEFKGDKFYCSVCQKKFAGLETARKHLRQVHGEKKYKCGVCQKGFTYEHKARIHEKRHLKIKPFMCDICGGTFVDKTNLENHMKKNLCSKYTCVWCDQNFRSKIILQKHLSQCGQRNADSTEDKTKLYGKPAEQSSSSTDEAKWQYECAKCKKKFKSKLTLRSHIINEFNLTPYKCFICNQRFQTTVSLKKHLDLCNKSIADCSDPSLIVNSDNLFGCKLCGRKFRKMGYLRQHFRLHSNTKPYVCQFCGKSYTLRSSFRSHMLTEMNLRGYACSACGKRYNSSSHLTTHIKKHHRLREFKCDACDKEFAYERDLKEHEKTHSDAKSSFCEKCGGLFKTKRYLKVHLERCNVSEKH